MTSSDMMALFVVEAEAERAATKLRAAGIPDAAIVIAPHAPETETREDEVGVPDSAMGVDGLRGDDENEEPKPTVKLTIGMAHARADRSEIIAILTAAGGRID